MDTSFYNKIIGELKSLLSSMNLLGVIQAEDIIADTYLLTGDVEYDTFLSNCKKKLYAEKASKSTPGIETKERLRICSKCKETQPSHAFYMYTYKGKFRITSWCKTCFSKQGKDYRKRTAGKFAERDRIRNKEYNNREYVKSVRSTRRYKDKMNEYKRELYHKNIERYREKKRKHSAAYRERKSKDKEYVERLKEYNKAKWESDKKDPVKIEKIRERNREASKRYYKRKKEKLLKGSKTA